MTRTHRRVLLVIGALFDPIWNWKHRDILKREWKL